MEKDRKSLCEKSRVLGQRRVLEDIDQGRHRKDMRGAEHRSKKRRGDENSLDIIDIFEEYLDISEDH